MYRKFSENFSSICPAVGFGDRSTDSADNSESDRAEIARFKMRGWSDNSVNISVGFIQPFRRFAGEKKKQESSKNLITGAGG